MSKVIIMRTTVEYIQTKLGGSISPDIFEEIKPNYAILKEVK